MNASGGPSSAARALGPSSALVLGLSVLALAAVAAVLGEIPPRAQPASAPTGDFSAARAFTRLGRLLASGEPHPVGSAQNARLRARLEAEIRDVGLVPKLERGRACNANGTCAEVVNVIAELPGRTAGGALVLAAHYDSVATSPGAADDGAGVATALEVARALRTGAPLVHPVWLLFTDGEEAGMLGAELFVTNRERLRDIGAVINLEARGVRGPSLMFETSRNNLELVRSYARSVSRPVASSLFYVVYRMLPNDSDLSVFRRAGLSGVNFAFIGGAEHYHTARDDLAHLSLDSLQHQGDQTLALTRALARGAPVTSADEAVFFDVAGRTLVVLSVTSGRVLSAILGAAALALAAWALRRRFVSAAALAAALLAWLGSVALAVLAGICADAVLRSAGLLDEPWSASSGWIVAALHAAALGALSGAAALVGDALAPRPSLVLHALGVSAAGGACAILLPETLFVCLVPGVFVTLCATAAVRLGSLRALQAAAAAGLVGHALIWAPIGRILFDAIGAAAPALSAAAAVFTCLPLLPLVAGLAPRTRIRLTLLLAAQSTLAVGVVAAVG